MVKSMTGFGKAIVENERKKIVIEIKSLNSKQLDVSTKLPAIYKSKDIEIRNMIKESLERGKVEFSIYYDHAETEKEVAINEDVVSQYFKQMEDIASNLNVIVNKMELLQTVVRFPEIFNSKTEELNEEEWENLKKGIAEALSQLNNFRAQEGSSLIKDVLYRIDRIEELSEEVVGFEQSRIDMVRKRIEEKLKEWTDGLNIDKNRMEQEIIYYLEKLDITEEKVRLHNHCSYFRETASTEETPGRKLGFIAQEIGREINTMGSKANEHNIQKLVVQMKDELEKIKEQLLNIL